MICPKCGSSITENKCRHCNSNRKHRSVWLKLIALIAVAASLFLLVHHLLVDNDLSTPVKGQLSAIRDDQLTEAYYGYTSEDFQKTVSLEAFREFVKNYPGLLKNRSMTIDVEQEENGFGLVKGDIKTNDSLIPVEYRLVKEKDEWKILSLQLLPNLIAQATTARPQADTREIEELLVPVNLQLKALQQKEYDKSYQGLMTKDFEKNTPFELYRRFIDSYPILSDYKSLNIREKKLEAAQGTVVVLLENEKGTVLPVEYRLAKEGGQWKIWSMRLVLPETDESSENAKVLSGIIRAQIDAIEKGNFAEAYKTYTSKDFQSVTSEEQFENLAKNFEVFQNKNVSDVQVNQVTNAGNVIILGGFLSSKDEGKYPFEYNFVNEDGQWKIMYMTISTPDLVNRAASIAKPKIGTMTFANMEIGDGIDSNGKIINPKDVLSVKDQDIYGNLQLRDGIKGNKVEVIVKHLDSGSNVPPVSAVVEEDGDSSLLFTFSPPAQGWPKGSYEIQVSSQDSAVKGYKFKIE